jgi:hypothetical protein
MCTENARQAEVQRVKELIISAVSQHIEQKAAFFAEKADGELLGQAEF